MPGGEGCGCGAGFGFAAATHITAKKPTDSYTDTPVPPIQIVLPVVLILLRGRGRDGEDGFPDCAMLRAKGEKDKKDHHAMVRPAGLTHSYALARICIILSIVCSSAEEQMIMM